MGILSISYKLTASVEFVKAKLFGADTIIATNGSHAPMIRWQLMTEQRRMSLGEAKRLWESVRAGGWAFKSYYKYSFTYQSKVNPKVTINLGGDRDNIYRENFTAEMDFSKDELSDVQWLYNAVDDSYYSQPETW